MVGKNAHYLMCKGGVFYFTRHVPNDLQKHYETPRIVNCFTFVSFHMFAVVNYVRRENNRNLPFDFFFSHAASLNRD